MFGFLLSLVTSFLLRYADMVLKSLPDIRTLVSLWRSLVGKKKRVISPNRDDLMEGLVAEDRMRNAGGYKSSKS